MNMDKISFQHFLSPYPSITINRDVATEKYNRLQDGIDRSTGKKMILVLSLEVFLLCLLTVMSEFMYYKIIVLKKSSSSPSIHLEVQVFHNLPLRSRPSDCKIVGLTPSYSLS